MRLPSLFPALALFGVLSCDTATTAPPPPILATEGMFEFTVTGNITASLAGPAVFEDELGGLRVAMTAAAPAHEIEIGPGLLSSGAFAWPVGSHATNGLPGFGEIELRYTAGPDTYFSTSGTLTITESTADHVIAAVDIRAGGTSGNIRIRGSLHALVETP
jgi:hypothetical protein